MLTIISGELSRERGSVPTDIIAAFGPGLPPVVRRWHFPMLKDVYPN